MSVHVWVCVGVILCVWAHIYLFSFAAARRKFFLFWFFIYMHIYIRRFFVPFFLAQNWHIKKQKILSPTRCNNSFCKCKQLRKKWLEAVISAIDHGCHLWGFTRELAITSGVRVQQWYWFFETMYHWKSKVLIMQGISVIDPLKSFSLATIDKWKRCDIERFMFSLIIN